MSQILNYAMVMSHYIFSIKSIHLYYNSTIFLDFNLTKYTLALNPSCWLNLKTKGNPIKVSYLGQTNRLASLDNLNNIFVYDWCKADIKTVK